MQRMMGIFVVIFLFGMMISITPIEKEKLYKKNITIEIKGAVKNPGLIECAAYSTIEDVISEILFEEDADLSMLNLQTVLKDKDVLVIAKKTEDPLISINTASIDMLCTLDGIGPSTAQRIIDYRERYGLFQSIEELMNVKGIGKKKYERIQDKICL